MAPGMVDRARFYRRWAAGRLVVLGAAFLAVVGAGVWGGVHPSLGAWLRVLILPLAVLHLLLLGYFFAGTLACARFGARGLREEARAWRGCLSLYRPAAFFSLAFLMALVLAPRWLLERESDRRARPPDRPLRRPDSLPETLVKTAMPVEPPEREPAPPPPPARPPEQALAEAPPPEALRLPAPLEDLPAMPSSPESAPSGEERGLGRFPWEELERFAGEEASGPPAVSRPGLRDEKGDGWPLPEYRFDLIRLDLDHLRWGVGLSFLADIPVGRMDLLRTTWLTGVYFPSAGLEESLEGPPSFVWHHATFEYVRRLFGYAPEAPFDLALAAGLGADWIPRAASTFEVGPDLHLGPHAAVEVGIWQGGPVGFVFRAAQSVPVNLWGSVSSLTDLTGMVRVDLAEGISLHAGYRIFRIRLRAYPRAFAAEGARWEMEETSAGPLAGLDVRF